jgi:uncharacterized GH25 family protein
MNDLNASYYRAQLQYDNQEPSSRSSKEDLEKAEREMEVKMEEADRWMDQQVDRDYEKQQNSSRSE